MDGWGRSKYLSGDMDEEEDEVKIPISKRKDSGAGGMGSGDNPLDSFFPFDPYLLRRSSRFINHIYVRYTSGQSELDEDEWNEEGQRLTGGEPSPVVASLVSSLTGMSLTPISHSVDDFHQIVFGSAESAESTKETITNNLSKFTSSRHHPDEASW